jgi:hypothetical protein
VKQVKPMCDEQEIESWYLGVPFSGREKRRGEADRDPATPLLFPAALGNDEVELLYLGLPWKAA